MFPLSAADSERFLSKLRVLSDDECWSWVGTKMTEGYGVFWLGRRATGVSGGKNFRAHRIAYEWHYGAEPGELKVCHSCNNVGCCNPLHLYLGTDADNTADRKRANRCANRSGIRNRQAKLTDDAVREIRLLLVEGNLSQTEIGKRFGVSQTVVSKIAMGKIWDHVDAGPDIFGANAPGVWRKSHVPKGTPKGCKGELNGGGGRLTERQAAEIKWLCRNRTKLRRDIAAQYGVSYSLVQKIAYGKLWAWVEPMEPEDA